jgi:hypothetical protein
MELGRQSLYRTDEIVTVNDLGTSTDIWRHYLCCISTKINVPNVNAQVKYDS